MNQIELFHFEESKDNFENHSNENGFTYWSGRLLMESLGYNNWGTFNGVISKAMTTCNTLNIPIIDNFAQVNIKIDGKDAVDFKLSRFACYLIAMNGDSKKEQVAKAQAYFATMAGAIHDHFLEAEKVERVQIRSEVSEREKTLSGVAFRSGLASDGYALFQNAGYRGMYNMDIKRLKTLRKIDPKRSLLDFMGKDELAANLFRITQTELKIKNESVRGQAALERAAQSVGADVRDTMIKISGKAPEQLTLETDIKQVRSELKGANKTLTKIDKTKKTKKKK